MGESRKESQKMVRLAQRGEKSEKNDSEENENRRHEERREGETER